MHKLQGLALAATVALSGMVAPALANIGSLEIGHWTPGSASSTASGCICSAVRDGDFTFDRCGFTTPAERAALPARCLDAGTAMPTVQYDDTTSGGLSIQLPDRFTAIG